MKSWRPCSSGTRKSLALWMTSMGVLKFLTYIDGDHFVYCSGLVQGVPWYSHSGNHSSSVAPYIERRSKTPSWETRQSKMSVWPSIQSIM